MKYLFKPILLFVPLMISSVHALEVDFEAYDPDSPNYNGVTNISSTFIGANITNPTQTLTGDVFGDGITFSGGVLLLDPVNGTTLMGETPTPINCATCGSVFYGSAASLSTNVITDEGDLPQTITINIPTAAQVNAVSGTFINGLNTSALTPGSFSNDYTITYTLNDGSSQEQSIVNSEFNFGMDTESFGLDISSSLLFITMVELTAEGVPFPGGLAAVEWDFLLDAIRFDSNIAPVPLPAGLPLFISALLGGFVIARPRKSSDTK